jgi:hypothetical protein
MVSFDTSALLACETSGEMEAASAELASKVSSAGPVRAMAPRSARIACLPPGTSHGPPIALFSQGALKDSGLVEKFKAELGDKGKAKANQRAATLHAMTALLSTLGDASEAYLVPLLPDAIEGLSDKAKPVQLAAADFIKEVTATASPNAVRQLLEYVLPEYESKWQGNLGRAEMLGELSAKHPAQMARHLTEVIPVLNELMYDVKPQVPSRHSNR